LADRPFELKAMAGQMGSAMQSSAAIGCMKTLLMVFNFVFWLSGIAILALGIWMKVQLYIYVELTTMYYAEGPYVLIGIGAAIVLVGSLGCLCTVKGKSFLLYLYAAFLVIVFVVELSVGIAGFVYRSKLEEGFKKGLDEAMDNYHDDEQKRDAMDGLQEGLECCGRQSYSDWFSRPTWNGEHTAPQSVPKSCCIHVSPECDNTNLPTPGTEETNSTLPVWTEGCHSKVASFMEKNFGIIGGVAIGFAFLQLFGALLACGLAKNINKASYEQVA